MVSILSGNKARAQSKESKNIGILSPYPSNKYKWMHCPGIKTFADQANDFTMDFFQPSMCQIWLYRKKFAVS